MVTVLGVSVIFALLGAGAMCFAAAWALWTER